MTDQRAGGSACESFVPDPNDDEFCDVCGHPPSDHQRAGEVGCTFVMFRGAMTGRVITCGICDWCRNHWPSRHAEVSSPDVSSQPVPAYGGDLGPDGSV